VQEEELPRREECDLDGRGSLLWISVHWHVGLFLEGKAVSDIARTFNVHPATIYRLADADSSDFQIAIHS
jgi:hypothetical protein